MVRLTPLFVISGPAIDLAMGCTHALLLVVQTSTCFRINPVSRTHCQWLRKAAFSLQLCDWWPRPRRGGMLCPPKKGYTEEDYYFGEWTAAERENGEHMAVVKFVRF